MPVRFADVNGDTAHLATAKTPEKDAEKDHHANRGAWGSQLEFILTMVGFAVGLGNVWRFPYLCYKNGGGAFLIPYFISLLVLGIPIFWMEICFGQFASLGPIKIYRINPAMKGVGMSVVLITLCIIIYYNVVVAYCIFYFFASMTSSLPWVTCDNEWNTCFCRDPTMPTNTTFPWANTSRLAIECADTFVPFNQTTSPSEEYFLHRVLRRTNGLEETGDILWDLSAYNLLGWTIIFLVLSRGVESLGKVMYFVSVFPYILLTVLLVRGLTLEGHSIGIDFYLKPDLSKLMEAQVWSDAAVQIFYSLSICQGGLIAMSSFNNFKTNTLRDSLLVPLINCATSFYAGFVIFSVLGFMAHNKQTSVQDVVADGPGLIFMVYPEALSQMPMAPLWSVLFFLMMTMLGFSSQFSATETVLTSIMDEFPHIRTSRWKTMTYRAAGCFMCFLLGLPMTTGGGLYLLNLVDNYVGGFPLLWAGLFEIITIIYIYGVATFKKDIEMMLGKRVITDVAFKFFMPMWRFLTPVCLVAVIIFKAIQYKPLTMGDYDYPDYGDAIGWLTVGVTTLVVPGWFIFHLCRKGGVELVREVNKPKLKWGPAKPDDRGDRYRLPDYKLFTLEQDGVLDMKIELDDDLPAFCPTELPLDMDGYTAPSGLDNNGYVQP